MKRERDIEDDDSEAGAANKKIPAIKTDEISTLKSTTETDQNTTYYIVRSKQDECIPGNYDDEVVDMAYIFQNRVHAMEAARRAAHEKNMSYYSGFSAMPLEEKEDGWKHRGEHSHYLYQVREIEVEEQPPSDTISSRSNKDDWIYAVVVLQEWRDQLIDSLHINKNKAIERFDTFVQELISNGQVGDEETTGDVLKAIDGEESYEPQVEKEMYLVTQINTDFDETPYDLGDDELREYIKEWKPRIDSTVQLVKLQIKKEPLSDDVMMPIQWIKSFKNPYARDVIDQHWSEEDKSQVLDKFDAYYAKQGYSD